MLLVTQVTGPSKIKAGDTATYTVTRFNQEHPSDTEASRVSWLVKTQEGSALTNVRNQGPQWSVQVPTSWIGRTLFVMPYMNSATLQISVKTVVEALPAQTQVPAGVTVTIEQEGRRYYASVNAEPRFYVGTEVPYGTRRGLMNSQNPYGPRYAPEDNASTADAWAYYLWPTIQCESRGAFNCINTYDRARFTYGHMQFAAHTPDENFVLLFRELLSLPSAAVYFPDLTLQNGSIHEKRGQTWVQLESGQSTVGLQAYLNPDEYRIDDRSVGIAARFMDWCARDPRFVETMTGFAFRNQRQKLRRHAAKLVLDGLSDKLCLVIMDILHQGRAKYATIKTALNQGDPFDALLSIGLATYRDRIATLRAGILDLERMGHVGKRIYDTAAGDFIVAGAA